MRATATGGNSHQPRERPRATSDHVITSKGLVVALITLAGALLTGDVAAQYPPRPGYPPPGYPPRPGYPQPGYGRPGYPPPGYPSRPGYPPPGYPSRPGYPQPGYGRPGYPGYGAPGYYSGKRRPAPGPELASLYVTSAIWGVGTGVWIDMEAGVDNVGVGFIAPVVLGVAAPAAVAIVDGAAFRDGMPEGLPSAVSAGLVIGAAEGLGIASYQSVTASDADAWGIRGLSRSVFLGSTVGGIGGGLLGYFLEPAPETNVFVGSATVWGATIGSFLGGGASAAGADWSQTNDSLALGGLVGLNLAVVGAATTSVFWTPSYNQIAWMWGGMAIGAVATTPIYFYYALADDEDTRRGLIFQGVGGTIGLVLGGILGKSRPTGPAAGMAAVDDNTTSEVDDRPIRLYGGGLMPVDKGIGLQLQGALW